MLFVHFTTSAGMRLKNLWLPIKIFNHESETARAGIISTPVVIVFFVSPCLSIEEKFGSFKV